VNDGGYIYSKFEALYPQDLVENVITEPTKKFKKLFQLQPNMSQVVFDTSDIDYSQEAQTQLENLRIGDAEELIWDKTFKLRLTSKKTGKKIDLNITYKLNSE
jgi:hypothetical protein